MVVDLIVCLDSTTPGAPALLAKAVSRAAACRARLRVLDLCAPDALGMATSPTSLEFVEDMRAAFRLGRVDGHHEMAPTDPAGLLERTLSADLVIAGRGAATSPHRSGVSAPALGALGPPVLIEADGSAGPAGRRILLPWRADRASTRAIHDAMPLLKTADEVVLVPLDDGSPATVMRRLAGRGVRVRAETSVDDADSALAPLARRVGADLIVVGLGGPAHWRAPTVLTLLARLIDDSSTALLVSR
ncbi:universal stress protein [Lichenibacterium dinghuense]|uniref:universal stress protein n=1 Tax=Lichenibacterium dinghuense TaxID=2895977 RepID=UPI001F42FE20|nr:universal stress protein [Lichenibacterium sp. 6Y81]